MCLDPVTMMLVITAISTGVQAYGAYQEQQATNKAAEYRADMLDRNAKNADIQAKDSERRGDLEAQQHRLKVSQLQGEQKTAFASSGVVVDEGSALGASLETAHMGELDALTLKRNASMEAWGYKNEAADYRGQASLTRATKRNPWMAAGTTLLTGASKMSSQYASAKG